VKWMYLAFNVIISGCYQPLYIDTDSPFVQSVTPEKFLLSDVFEFNITFSEPMWLPSLNTGNIVIMPVDEYDETFQKDFAKLPLAKVRNEVLIPCEIEVVNKRKITVKVIESLQDNIKYVLLLSSRVLDATNNPLRNLPSPKSPFRWDFLVRHKVPKILNAKEYSSSLVPPNRFRFDVRFSRPIELVENAFKIMAPNGASKPNPRLVYLESDKRKLVLEFDHGETCHIFSPDTNYEFQILSRGVDSEAVVMSRTFFQTGPACSVNQQRKMVERVVPSETSAIWQIAAPTEGMSFLWVFDEEEKCIPWACPLLAKAPFRREQGMNRPVYMQDIMLKGLMLGNEYGYQIRYENHFGIAQTSKGKFLTIDLPDVSINEVMLNPVVARGDSENSAEYIEIINWGDRQVLLENYQLVLTNKLGKSKSCSLPLLALEPSEIRVIVGSGFVPDYYSNLSEKRIVRLSKVSICDGIPNTSLRLIALRDSEDRVVSSLTIPEALGTEGYSVERVQPDAMDTLTNICYSRPNIGPTPGTVNSVFLQGCSF